MVGESGIKLSGGQRQRLAIARSIIREPAILILDEATSAIDVRGERIVQKALERVSQNRTTIVIAHRLSTIRKADKIIVMREGRNMEEGTHDELLSLPDGIYAGLVQAQQLENESAPKDDDVDEAEYMDALARKETITSLKQGTVDEAFSYKTRGFWRSVGLFLWEQRSHWRLYCLVLVAAIGAGCECFSLPTISALMTVLTLPSRILPTILDLRETHRGVPVHGRQIEGEERVLVADVLRSCSWNRSLLFQFGIRVWPSLSRKNHCQPIPTDHS